SLQAENVATGHHVMTGEGVPQDVGHLPWRVESASFVGASKRGAARHEQPTVSRHAQLQCQLFNVLRYRHRSGLAVLSPVKVRLAAVDRGSSERFGLIPSSTSSQAKQRNGVRVVVGGSFALFE